MAQALVIFDHSGSMNGERYQNCRQVKDYFFFGVVLIKKEFIVDVFTVQRSI